MIHSDFLILLVFNSVLIRRYWCTLFWKSNFVTTLYFWNIISIIIEVGPFLLIHDKTKIFQAWVCHLRGIPFPIQPWLTTVSLPCTFEHHHCKSVLLCWSVHKAPCKTCPHTSSTWKNPEHLGFTASAQAFQGALSFGWSYAIVVCLHTPDRHVTWCWRYKHGYLFFPGGEQIHSAKGDKIPCCFL